MSSNMYSWWHWLSYCYRRRMFISFYIWSCASTRQMPLCISMVSRWLFHWRIRLGRCLYPSYIIVFRGYVIIYKLCMYLGSFIQRLWICRRRCYRSTCELSLRLPRILRRRIYWVNRQLWLPRSSASIKVGTWPYTRLRRRSQEGHDWWSELWCYISVGTFDLTPV